MAECTMFIPMPGASRDYVLGSEHGRLCVRLEASPPEWSGTYHADNAEQLRTAASALGYVAEFEPSGADGWVFGTFRRRVLTLVETKGATDGR